MRNVRIVFVALAVAALAGSSYGFMVTNVTNNEVVFKCGSENGTVGENPTEDMPEIGTWDLIGAQHVGGNVYEPFFYPDLHFVYDAASSPDGITPYYGGKDLNVVGGAPRPYIHSDHAGTPAVAGDLIKVEFAFNAVNGWSGIQLREEVPSDYTASPPWPISIGSLWWTATAEAAWGGGWEEVGCVHMGGDVWSNAQTPGQWSEVVIEYVCGSTTADVTIDAASHEFVVTPAILNHVSFGAPSSYGIAYLDAPGVSVLLADFNDDGVIDDLDLTILATHWQQAGGHSEGDANDDGFIDDLDLTALATEWPTGDLAPSIIPEPATLSLLVLGGLAALRRRNRR